MLDGVESASSKSSQTNRSEAIMDLQSVLAEVGSWPEADRLQLIEEVWDGLSDDGAEPEPSEELKAELDRRVEEMDRNPETGISWEVAKACVLERFRK